MRFLSLLLLLIISFSSQAQSLDDEIDFMYTKAKYLLETNRTEDAVKQLNKIISKDANYKDALLLRAEAKYQLGAYAGVRKDLGQFINENGLTPRVARLYGLTDFQGGKSEAALNSLTLALHSIKDDKKMYEVRGQIYESNNQLIKACKDFKAAAKLGSNAGKRKSKSLCGDDVEEEKPTKKRRTHIDANSVKKDKKDAEKEEMEEEEEVEEAEVEGSEVTEEKEDEEMEDEEEELIEEEIIEDRVNTIVVDDDLTLVITGGGLGSRAIADQPNVLILSDDSGEVAIDVCVSRAGRVTSAEFDNINSTIKKQSLVSLALRKSKDFWFEKNGTKEQCGKIIFQIKGL